MNIVKSGSFEKWIRRLRDERAKGLIAARLHSLAEGNPGDVEQVGDGVRELRLHFGPGYRIYFHRSGDSVVVLLCDGDKSTQVRDIRQAKQILNEWREHHG